MENLCNLLAPGEQPLDRIVENGGCCAIFRTIGCIGDSLSSGEFESVDELGTTQYHDYFEYSWGQYLGRACGSKVYNFSRGGMTASEYWNSFGEEIDAWNEEKRCQAYILALGVNDICNEHQVLGTTADVDLADYHRNGNTFAGYYARIIQRLKTIQPDARFFLMTMPRSADEERCALIRDHAALLHELAALFSNTYVLDFAKYAPVYGEEFRKIYYLGGHMNPMGYLLTSRMVMSYIDYLIRKDPAAFSQVGFIGTPFRHHSPV